MKQILLELALKIALALLPSLEQWLQSVLAAPPPAQLPMSVHEEVQKALKFVTKK